MSDRGVAQQVWPVVSDRPQYSEPKETIAPANWMGTVEGGNELEDLQRHPQVPVSSQSLDAYLGSYVGMEGNPSADLWFCDVKSHGEAVPLASPLSPVSAPLAWDADFRLRHREILPRLATQQKIARIVAAARNGRADSGGCDSKQYFDRHLYGASGWEFKLSLFPLPAGEIGTRSWARAHWNQPALTPQGRYFALCREGRRFKFMAELRKRMQPKVIVCLGTRNSDDFLCAFGFTGAKESKHVLQPADLGKPISVHIEGPGALLICPPLAGASGLNSDVLQEALGKYIAQFM